MREDTSFLAEKSSNVSDDGYFSIQVLSAALKVAGLEIVSMAHESMSHAREEPQACEAFICHLERHWFTVRRLGDAGWFNLNSLKPFPERVSDFYLSAFLAQLRAERYSIFVVKVSLCEGSFRSILPIH